MKLQSAKPGIGSRIVWSAKWISCESIRISVDKYESSDEVKKGERASFKTYREGNFGCPTFLLANFPHTSEGRSHIQFVNSRFSASRPEGKPPGSDPPAPIKRVARQSLTQTAARRLNADPPPSTVSGFRIHRLQMLGRKLAHHLEVRALQQSIRSPEGRRRAPYHASGGKACNGAVFVVRVFCQ